MRTLTLILMLAAVLGFFLSRVQAGIRRGFESRPGMIWAVPIALTAVFSGTAVLAEAWSLQLCLVVLGYTAAPVACAAWQGVGPVKRPTVFDFVTILLLWLPLEFGAGAGLIPIAARGYLHSVAYGIAILLGMVLFSGFRSFPDLKFNSPRTRTDWWLPVAAFAVAAPVLMVLGIAVGFIPWPHLPGRSAGAMSAAVAVIFAGTALPEEILFRSLIQNLLTLRFGAGVRTLMVASFIFGCAHLDNGPQPLPNWRYMILATVAGIAYGWVFQRASTVLSSAALHMLVDWTKHFFF
jgi:membrane protease YdiL (CAAX protease family)